jgi:hypothetical protein
MIGNGPYDSDRHSAGGDLRLSGSARPVKFTVARRVTGWQVRREELENGRPGDQQPHFWAAQRDRSRRGCRTHRVRRPLGPALTGS